MKRLPKSHSPIITMKYMRIYYPLLPHTHVYCGSYASGRLNYTLTSFHSIKNAAKIPQSSIYYETSQSYNYYETSSILIKLPTYHSFT